MTPLVSSGVTGMGGSPKERRGGGGGQRAGPARPRPGPCGDSAFTRPVPAASALSLCTHSGPSPHRSGTSHPRRRPQPGPRPPHSRGCGQRTAAPWLPQTRPHVLCQAVHSEPRRVSLLTDRTENSLVIWKPEGKGGGEEATHSKRPTAPAAGSRGVAHLSSEDPRQ